MVIFRPTWLAVSHGTSSLSGTPWATLVFLQTRINLSPFTKDFRGGEQLNESIDQFFVALP